MSDISKCNGEGCKIKTICVRFNDKPDKWQSYMIPQVEPDGYHCQMFLYDREAVQKKLKAEKKEIKLDQKEKFKEEICVAMITCADSKMV